MLRVTITDPTSHNKAVLELEPDQTVDDIIVAVANYWNKEPNAYLLRRGQKLLSGGLTVKDLKLKENDTLDLVLDPVGA